MLASAWLASCSDTPLSDRPNPNQPTTQGETCVPADTPCAVTFRYPLGHGVNSVELRGDFAADGWTSGVPLLLDGTEYRTEINAPNATTIRYKFVLNGVEWVIDPNNPNTEADGVGGENSLLTTHCEYTPCASEPDPPVVGSFDWRSAVLYFVFVDRFRNGDPSNDNPVPGVETAANYQGGDYRGVIDAIEEGYFASLGVNALWLSVPMDNPNTPGAGHDGHLYSGYHGYWPSDLNKVEEHFGSMADLQELVDTAHQAGIKVLLDYAMNHVHVDNPLVAQHPDWFWPLAYNNSSCVCGDGCDWNDSYEQKRCWFTDYLPDWNYQNEQARAFSVDNAVQWIQNTGIDGFRLDAVKHIELQWLLDLRQRVRNEVEPQTGEHFYMVGETFESGDRDVLKFYVGADRLDGQFDFVMRGLLVELLLRRSGTMYDLDGFLATNDNYYPGIMSTFIGNHDLARVIHSALDQPWGAWENGQPWSAPPPLPDYAAPFERLAVAYTFLMTTRGVPLLYYGDELGMAGAGDPDNRRFMQWDGLSEHQIALRNRLQKLGAIRRDHPALWRGKRTTVSVSSDAFAYRQVSGDDVVFVALNRGDVVTAVAGMPSKGRDLLTGAATAGPQLNLPPRSAMIIVAE